MKQPQFEQPDSPDFIVLADGFFDIEEVLVLTEDHEIIDGGSIEPGDIKEVTSFSRDHVVDGGIISMRKHLATTVLSLWIAWTLAGLFVFLGTGNTILLLGSPAIMSIPLYKVIGYYFR